LIAGARAFKLRRRTSAGTGAAVNSSPGVGGFSLKAIVASSTRKTSLPVARMRSIASLTASELLTESLMASPSSLTSLCRCSSKLASLETPKEMLAVDRRDYNHSARGVPAAPARLPFRLNSFGPAAGA
jgi:hypothetical protein